MQITEKPALKFEEVIRKATENLLITYGFTIGEQTIFYRNSHIDFVRHRENNKETIRFARRRYYRDEKDFDDEVEKTGFDKDYGEFSDSRHWFQILLIANFSHRNLLTTGEAGIGKYGEEHWYFEDEEDLQRVLREKILPLLKTAAMKDFNEQLADKLEHPAKYTEGKQNVNKGIQTNDETTLLH